MWKEENLQACEIDYCEFLEVQRIPHSDICGYCQGMSTCSVLPFSILFISLRVLWIIWETVFSPVTLKCPF